MKKCKFKKIFLNMVIITSVFFQNTVFADEIKTENNESNKEKFIEKKWIDNPTSTRLFLSPTARTLKKGKGYFQDRYIIIASANYGITDNISVGAIGSLFPNTGIENQLYGVTSKIGYEITKDLNVAGNILLGNNPFAFYSNPINKFGLGYGVATYGNADNNITLGFGSLFQDPSYNDHSSLVIIGGMYRVSEYISVLSENLVLFGSYSSLVLPSLGIRLFGENLSVDIGIFVVPSQFIFASFPYIDLVFSF